MINFQKIGKYLLALVVTAVLIAGISGVQRKLDDDIRTHELFFTGQINNAPPMVAFTTMALGSFRGIVADLLWLRAENLKQSGNYYEMVQLASWITKLQPRFASATAYLAWNMAYNISVTCSLWQDRWYWVWEGIKLIRDEALLYNPRDARLYSELAGFFLHKLGNVMDNASYYYKWRLATEMEAVITPTPDWEFFSTMPATEADFLQTYPETDEIWSAAHRAGFADYQALTDDFRANGMLSPKFVDALGNAEKAKNIDGALRMIWLNEKYRLRASTILAINREYGDLDWRLPEAQAMYWAYEGIQVIGYNVSCSRVIATSLQEMTRAGRLLWVERADDGKDNVRYIILEPNLDLVLPAIRTYDWAREKSHNIESFRTGKINFMKTSIVNLVYFGRRSEALEVYELLKQEEGNPADYPSFDELLEREYKELLETATFKQITDFINAFIQNALNALVNDDEEAAVSYLNMSRKIHRDYQKDITDSKEQGRRGLVDYEILWEQAIQNYLRKANPTAAAIIRSKLGIPQPEAANTEKK